MCPVSTRAPSPNMNVRWFPTPSSSCPWARRASGSLGVLPREDRRRARGPEVSGCTQEKRRLADPGDRGRPVDCGRALDRGLDVSGLERACTRPVLTGLHVGLEVALELGVQPPSPK